MKRLDKLKSRGFGQTVRIIMRKRANKRSDYFMYAQGLNNENHLGA